MKHTLKITFINCCVFLFIVVSVFAYIMYKDKQNMVEVTKEAIEQRDNCVKVLFDLEEWKK